MFYSVKNFLEKNLSETEIDKKLNTIKGKILGSSSPKQARDRRYALTFSQTIQIPPPLPSIQPNSNYLKTIETDYSENPFSFYFEEFEESFPAPNLMVEEELPTIQEPQEGLHPYGMDLNAYQAKRQTTPAQDITPHFLRGKPTPIKNYNQTPANVRILNVVELQSSLSLSQITYLCIQDTKVTGKTKKLMFKNLGQCVNLETMILKKIDIGSIRSSVRLPCLRFCDLSQNRINSMGSIKSILKHSPLLEVLNLMGNSIVKDDYYLRISGKLPLLEVVSQKQLTIDDRIRAIQIYGTYEQRQRIDQTRWELNLDNIQEIRNLRQLQPGWQPQLIHTIAFPNSQLRYFYVGNFPNLNHLDLSNNLIFDISQSGLEKCDHLFTVNFRNNILSKPETINIFEFTPSIRYITLSDNPRLTGYRQRLVYLTRNVKGTNRTIGLVQIDDVAVSKDEKIKAVEVFEPGNNASAIYRWKLLLIERFGHKQLQTIPDLLSHVKNCTFPKSGISICDISAFVNVQILDFSFNGLVSFTGLQHLKKLRILYLNDNPDLDTNHIVQQLLNTDSLESFNFFVSQTGHPRSPNSPGNKDYRALVLKTIVPKNRSLLLVDNTTISYSERVQAYASSGFPVDVVEKYRFFLSLTVNCTMHFNRGIHPDQVEIGKQYDPNQITALRRLRDWNLISDVCNFSFFQNLTEIDLTNNKFTDILNVGFQSLSQLKKLCLVNNQIQTPLPMIAQFLDSMSSLEIIALRGNPIMKTPNDRLTLIGLMASMKQLVTTLKVIDTEVTIYDKVEGWKLAGGSLMDAESFKLTYIVKMKSIDLFDHNLVHLELCDCGLEFLDITKFVNIKTLLLPNNRFKRIKDIQHLVALKELFALDLRFNDLMSVEEVRESILEIPGLQALGLFGNPFTRGPNNNSNYNYRPKFLAMINPLFQHHLYPLSILDTSEITVEEITEGVSSLMNSNSSDKKELMFNISLLRKSTSMQFELITELDLRGSGLTFMNLSKFPRLVVLCLSDNNISDNNLKDSGINTLSDLKALDLRNNKLKDLIVLCKIVDLLNVETLFLEENPCFDKDSQKDRVRFFKKLTNSKVLTTLKYLNGTTISSLDTSKFGKSKSRK
eukprot:gene7517-9238_t